MDIILQGLEHVAVILHDILIMGKDDEQHIQNLNSVLRCLNSSGLELQPNKSEFMQQLVTFMGCVIFTEGISPTEENIEGIKKVPCFTASPTEATDLSHMPQDPWIQPNRITVKQRRKAQPSFFGKTKH